MTGQDSERPPLTLDWREGQDEVRWVYQGVAVVKAFRIPPQTVAVAPDPLSIVVVEAFDQRDPFDEPARRLDNAIVFEPDGRERTRLIPPALPGEQHWRLGFSAVFAGPAGLVAVFSTTVGDFWGRPDLMCGELSQVAEWR